ncbi:MAG: Trk system potassium transporter TrkA [Bacteroidales bacterium]|nr:Trk system potassium transporter TrkA [Bacteroidales bacterium]
MKAIIAGAGEAGIYLANLLYKAKRDITIIDLNKERLEYIDSHYDFLTRHGSATSIKDLINIGIAKTDLFIALTQSEEVNLTATILAKKLGAKKVIARIDNKEYLEKNNEIFFKELGIDSMIYPEILASDEIISLLSRVGASKTFSFADGKLFLFAIKINENAPILFKTLQEVTKETGEFDFRAVAVTRDHKTIIPKGFHAFHAGDMFYVVCKKESINKLMQLSGKKHFKVENIMIMGGSRIGYKTASHCEKKSNVKLIEQNRAKCEKLSEMLENTLVIHGDGRDTDLLKEEGIAGMDVFIAVTGNSETNILACLHAKKLGVTKTIAEIEKMDYLPLAEEMGIETVINKKTIAASHIYSHIMSEQVSSVQCLLDSDAEILEFTVPKGAKITKKELKDTKFPKKAIIGGVIRNNEVFIAKGDTHIQFGDKVVLFALPEAIDKVSKFFS